MKRYIEFKKKKYKKLELKIYPTISFQFVLSKMDLINFIGSGIPSEHIVYAVLELLNNSLRAHRKKHIKKPISLEFTTLSEGFEIVIRDWGGGFDLHSLPYNLDAEIDEINIHDEKFEQYRQENNYKKFGLGLYLARKTFPVFELSFFDRNRGRAAWSPGNTAGTEIRLRTSPSEDVYQIQADPEVLYEKQENI